MPKRDPAEQIEAYCRRIARSALAESSVKMYQLRARMFGEFITAGGEQYADVFNDQDVRDYTVREWRRTLMTGEPELSQATINQHMSVVKAVCENAGIGKPTIPAATNPVSDTTGLEEADLRRVMARARGRGVRDFALVATLAGTGIRIGEAAALDVHDVAITERTGQLHVRYGKGGIARKLPLGPETRKALAPWLLERPGDPDRGPLWTARSSERRLSKRALYQVVKNVGRDAGVDLHPHALRHTAARRMLDKGVPLTDVAQLLGHKSLQTTAIYTKPTAEDLERAVAAAELEA